MQKYLIITALILLTDACEGRKQTKEKGEFNTTDQSELFFQNVRSSYYHKEIMPVNKVHIYTLKNTPQHMQIKPSIVYNWKEDQAFIMLNFTQLEFPVYFTLASTTKTDTVLFTGHNMSNHKEVALAISEAISTGHKVFYIDQGQQIEILNRPQEKEAFTIVARDFKRLIE